MRFPRSRESSQRGVKPAIGLVEHVAGNAAYALALSHFEPRRAKSGPLVNAEPLPSIPSSPGFQLLNEVAAALIVPPFSPEGQPSVPGISTPESLRLPSTQDGSPPSNGSFPLSPVAENGSQRLCVRSPPAAYDFASLHVISQHPERRLSGRVVYRRRKEPTRRWTCRATPNPSRKHTVLRRQKAFLPWTSPCVSPPPAYPI